MCDMEPVNESSKLAETVDGFGAEGEGGEVEEVEVRRGGRGGGRRISEWSSCVSAAVT